MDFKEEQLLNIPLLKIIFIITCSTVSIALGFVLYQSDQEGTLNSILLITPFIFIGSLGLAYYILFRTTLETSISSAGLTYRYSPFIRKNKTIPFNEIISWQIKPFKSIFDYGGYGYKRNIFIKKTSFIMGKADVLILNFMQGKTISISTNSSYMLGAAIRKYLPEKEIR